MVHSPPSPFVDRIEACIELVGGKASELATRAGLSGPVIGKYRHGKSEPGLSAMVALASAAGVTIEWLATGKGQKFPAKDAPSESTSEAASGDYISIPELIPGSPGSTPRRAISFGGIAAKVRRDLAASVFADSNLGALGVCRLHDSSLQPEVKKGEWTVIDTSKRELFPGVGAFRIGDVVTIRAMHLVDVVSGSLPKYEVTFRMRANQTSPLILTNEDLGDHIDLLGEVVFAGRLGLAPPLTSIDSDRLKQ